MPIYEYQCDKCGDVFEVMQKFSDAPVTEHEKCGGKVEKLISRSGFQLKGGGWYVTDYAKSGAPKEGKTATAEAKSEGSSASDSKPTDSKAPETKSTESKSSESKTESKPAAKKE